MPGNRAVKHALPGLAVSGWPMFLSVPRWTLAPQRGGAVAEGATHPPDRRGLLDDMELRGTRWPSTVPVGRGRRRNRRGVATCWQPRYLRLLKQRGMVRWTVGSLYRVKTGRIGPAESAAFAVSRSSKSSGVATPPGTRARPLRPTPAPGQSQPVSGSSVKGICANDVVSRGAGRLWLNRSVSSVPAAAWAAVLSVLSRSVP